TIRLIPQEVGDPLSYKSGCHRLPQQDRPASEEPSAIDNGTFAHVDHFIVKRREIGTDVQVYLSDPGVVRAFDIQPVISDLTYIRRTASLSCRTRQRLVDQQVRCNMIIIIYRKIQLVFQETEVDA